MGWTSLLFGFSGRINRARFWFATFLSIVYCLAAFALFLFFASGLLNAIGEGGSVPTATMPALMIAATPFIAGMAWMWAATAVKRLHDRDRSAWWLAPYFLLPMLMEILGETIGGVAGLASALVALAISVWAFIELYCLRGTPAGNRFGPDPLASDRMTARRLASA